MIPENPPAIQLCTSIMEGVKTSLASEKNRFLEEVETSIRKYIISTGKNCIAINQMKNGNTIYITWYLNDLDSYAKVLYHFLKNKKAPTYKGYKLDSALSKPIVDIVIDRWTSLFVSQGDAISEGIIKSLVADEVKLKRFLTRISEVALSSVSVKVRNKIIDQNRRPDRR